MIPSSEELMRMLEEIDEKADFEEMGQWDLQFVTDLLDGDREGPYSARQAAQIMRIYEEQVG